MTYSYHIFYFPFKWQTEGSETKTFSEQICLDNIKYRASSSWEHAPKPESEEEEKSLYNEKNYYYKFVHNILYDETGNPLELIRHFERKEPKLTKNIHYLIKVKGRKEPFILTVDAININLYATGVGFMSFYLKNEEESQSNPEDILLINQYGRRIFPPFYDDITYRNETSEYIDIQGLYSPHNYKEDFKSYKTSDCWKPASFILNLIQELADNILIEPIIDDRMFVACWYKNNELAKQFTDDPQACCDPENDFSSFWYKYLFVDGTFETCQNNEMKKKLLEEHTYSRWQKYSSLYGVCRYALVYLANDGAPDHLLACFQTIYARMVELVLVQRASMLRFSGEVTKVSNLSHEKVGVISNRISSLYKEYIRFINQIYFREVTVQDQGIELYAMLQKCLNMEEYIKDLDNEIGELHEYVSLKEDRSRNIKAEVLNNIATLFLPITVITGFWGMNPLKEVMTAPLFNYQVWMLIAGTLCALIIIYNRKKRL